MPCPSFIIIGAMKCATSTLYRQLALQGGIIMSEPKEPNYFSNDEIYARGTSWYSGLFAHAGADDLCGEASTHYTKLPTYPETVQRMKGALSEPRLIYIMRHPVERLVSQYVHEWSQREIDTSIDDALRAHPELIAYSRYSMQLQPYLEAFGPDCILPVFHERLLLDPQGELERIGRFIRYPGRPVWDQSQATWNVSNRRMRKSRWRDSLVDAPVLNTIRKRLVPRFVREHIKRLWMMTERPTLPVQQLARLEAIFDEDLDRLGNWLGIPLSCDGFDVVCDGQSINWTRECLLVR